jgi:Cu/Ag efflux protein CusF
VPVGLVLRGYRRYNETMLLRSAFGAALLFTTLHCSKASQDSPGASAAAAEHYASRGRVVSITAKDVEIRHEMVPGVRGYDGTRRAMDSMTMPFAITAGAPVAGIAVSDIVSFEFSIHFDSSPTLRLTRIAKLPPDTKLDLPGS